MAYVGIGNRQDYVADFQSQNFSGDGSTTAFTLNYEAVTGSIRVAVDNVLQPADGSSYTCNGFTLNFSAAPASGTDNITVLFLGTVRNIASVSDGAIVTSKIADGAVTSAKLDSGKVLQVVTSTYSVQQSTTSSTFVDSNLSVSITPSSASNKILIITSNTIGASTSGVVTYVTIDRAGTNLGNGTDGMMLLYSASGEIYGNGSMTILDSPNTTSSTTYKYQFRVGTGTGYTQLSNSKASMTAIEIKG